MNFIAKKIWATAAIMAVTMSFGQTAMALTVDDLVGTWNMTYDQGQGATSGTITVSKNADGSAKIMMSTPAGESEASNIAIEGDDVKFSRAINIQGQALTVNYTAKLVDGALDGTFAIDTSALGGAAGGGAGGPTPWKATKAN